MTTMTHSGKAQLTLPADNQILITREFDAPRHLVWRATTEPDLIRRWWGGKRGDVQSVDVDLRVGGKWRYVMNAKEGGFEVAFNGEYREIVPEERLVTTEAFEGAPGEPALNTFTLTEQDGRTTMQVLMEVSSKEVRDMIIETGMEGGMQESYDALEDVAKGLS